MYVVPAPQSLRASPTKCILLAPLRSPLLHAARPPWSYSPRAAGIPGGFACRVLSFQAFVILFQGAPLRDRLRHLWHTPRGAATIVSLPVSGASMAPFLYVDPCTLRQYGSPPRRVPRVNPCF